MKSTLASRLALTASHLAALTPLASAQLTWDPDGNQTSDGGAGTWDLITANWDDDGSAPNTIWVNDSNADFGGGSYQVDLDSVGVTVGDLTYGGIGGDILTLKGSTLDTFPGDLITIKSGGATWDTGGGEIEFFNDGNDNNTRLAMTATDTLTLNGGGVFDTGQNPQNNADGTWEVTGAILDVTGATIVRGHERSIGQFEMVKLAGGSTVIQERNADQTLIDAANEWELVGDVTFGNRYNRKSFMSGVISGTGRLTYKDGASQNTGFMRIDNAANTFSGGLTVDAENSDTMVFLNDVNDGVLGAVPGAFEADNIILKNGGTLRSNQDLTTDANRGITLDNGGILGVSNNKTFTIGGAIAGNGGLQIGYVGGKAGILELGGANATYTGQTQIFEGNVRLAATDALGQGVLNLGGTEGFARLILNDQSQTIGGVYNTGGLTKQIVNRNGTTTLSTTGTLTIDVADGDNHTAGSATGINAADDRGNFNIIKNGLGRQELGNLQIGGGVTVNAGTLQIGNTTGTSAVTGDISVTGGTLVIDEELVGVNSISVTGGGEYFFNLDSYLGTDPGAPTADFITLDGGILNVNLTNGTGGSFEIDSDRGITLGAGGGTIRTTTPGGAHVVTYNGEIAGIGALIKDKAQSLELGGANIYTGPTNVSEGRLRLTGSLTSDVTVASGASFVAGDQVAGSGSGSLPALTLEDGSAMVAYINSDSTDAGQAIVSGPVDIGTTATLGLVDQGSTALGLGTKLTLIDYTGGSLLGTFDGLAGGASIVAGVNTFTIDYADASKLTLTVVASSPYDTWAAGFAGLTGGFDGNHDGDALTNGQEWYFGGSDPLVADATGGQPLGAVTSTGPGEFTFTHVRPTDTSGATASYEWSTTLQGAFTANGASDGTYTVTLTPGVPVSAGPGYEIVAVTVSATPTTANELFARLRLSMP